MDSLTQTGCELFIRPPRANYKPEQLGPEKFTIGGRLHFRQDIQLMNTRKLRLECSHFKPLKAQRPWKKLPCVVYVHSNGGSRLEALEFLEIVLNYCFTYFCFDLSGSGMSEGEYISLGYHEQEDVKTVLQYLQETSKVSAIYLIGRSMGAATSILAAAAVPDMVQGIIVDSPFTQLSRLAEEIAANETRAPGFIVQPVVTVGLTYLARQIQKLAGFDIAQVSPLAVVDKCTQPALFLHGLEDTFIQPHHTKELHERYAGSFKRQVWFHGTHSSARTAPVFNEVSDFLYHLCLSPKHQAYMGPVSMPLVVAVKTLGSQYFLVKQPTSTGSPSAKVKPHVVLFVDPLGIQVKLPWMELVTRFLPYGRVFNYTVKDGNSASVTLEVYTETNMVTVHKFYTPEAVQIGEAIAGPILQATQDRLAGSAVPETLDRMLRQFITDAQKKQERVERKAALESVEPYLTKALASPLTRTEARRVAGDRFDEIYAETKLASPRATASRPMSPPRVAVVLPPMSPRAGERKISPDRLRSPMQRVLSSGNMKEHIVTSPSRSGAVSPVKPSSPPKLRAPFTTPAAAALAVAAASTPMAVPGPKLAQSKNTSPSPSREWSLTPDPSPPRTASPPRAKLDTRDATKGK